MGCSVHHAHTGDAPRESNCSLAARSPSGANALTTCSGSGACPASVSKALGNAAAVVAS